MKLSPREAARYFARPEPGRAGLLIYGPDPMRVALKRQEVVAALLGPKAEEEMRLTRFSAAELRGETAALVDAVKARGFFPGPRVVLLDEAGDGTAGMVETALNEWHEGDAQLVVTARQLTPRSALRKAFEGHPNAYAAGVYDDPPGRDEVEAMLARAGLSVPDRGAMGALLELATTLDPGDFRQTVEKLSLYKWQDAEPLTADEVALCAPRSTEADADALINVVAEARPDRIGPILRRLEAQGMAPVALCIGATRHFRQLHAAASDPEGPARGIARLRPPVHFKARDRMVRQAQSWGTRNLEKALEILIDTDLQLRSSQRAPQMALVERCLILLATLARRRA